jgi:ferredoxin
MSRRPSWWMTLQAFFYPFVLKLLEDTQQTFFGKISSRISVPFLSGKNFHITYLPINKSIEGIGESLIPQNVLEKIIKESRHRAIIKRCTCRDGNKCENHPVELGCLLLGEGASEIDTGVSRHVDVSQAIDHVRDCIENGLIPFVGRFRADDFLWGVRNRGKLLTMCFCCTCCCMIKNSVKHLPTVSQESVLKLKGLEIHTDHNLCKKCGVCISECFMDARSIKDGKIVCDLNLCKGCGRCISVCPENAITASVEDEQEAIEDIFHRVRTRVDYS